MPTLRYEKVYIQTIIKTMPNARFDEQSNILNRCVSNCGR